MIIPYSGDRVKYGDNKFTLPPSKFYGVDTYEPEAFRFFTTEKPPKDLNFTPDQSKKRFSPCQKAKKGATTDVNRIIAP